MRGFNSAVLCLAAALLGACGGGRAGDGGISGDPDKLPPKAFLEAPLSMGDIADTSSCFRTRQLVLQITGDAAGWKWKKLEDGTWQYETPSVSADGMKKGTITLRLKDSGNQVGVVQYEETQAGQLFAREKGASYMHTVFARLRSAGADVIPDCPDPASLQLTYP
jgi:hypothetical protein